MPVHVIADTADKRAVLQAMLQERHAVTSELLGETSEGCGEADAVDHRGGFAIRREYCDPQGSVREISPDPQANFPGRSARRVCASFRPMRWARRRVLGTPVHQARLLAQLADSRPGEIRLDDALHGAREAANAGAIAIGSMFSAVVSGKPVDVRGAKDAAGGIADSIAEDGLSSWLETVRRHHEGTYQHCLLVAGVAADFGLSLGLRATGHGATVFGGDFSRHRQGEDSARDPRQAGAAGCGGAGADRDPSGGRMGGR